MRASFSAIRAFVAVAQSKSFTRAANALNLSQSAVSHQVSKLEDLLGKKVFIREGRSIKLTELGEIYFHQVQSALNRLEEAEAQVTGATPSTLKILAQHSFLSYFITPRIATFLNHNPDISLEFDARTARDEAKKGEFDVVIGSWPPPHGYTIGYSHHNLWRPICNPDAVNTEAIAGNLQEVFAQRLITFENGYDWNLWSDANNLIYEPEKLQFYRQIYSGIATASAVSGTGIALSCPPLYSHYLETGKVKLIPSRPFRLPWGDIHISWPTQVASSRPQRLFVEWFISELDDLGIDNP